MFSQDYKKGMEYVVLSREKKGEIAAAMTAEPAKTAGRTLRVFVVAAVVCGLLVVTAAAYYMGTLEFLREQNEYAMLGMNEVYETCAQPVESSVTAENGDVFTVDRVATDGTFCTIFYCLYVQDETWRYVPRMTLRSGGEDISMEGYGNSFENQEYLADDHTLYGAWRFLLRAPLEDGEQVELELARYGEAEPGELAPLLWEKTLTFSVDPIQGEQFELDAVLSARMGGEPVQVEAVSLNRSPLGTLFRLRWAEEDTGAREWYDFVLRDGDTGTYIPYDQVVINHYWDPEGYVDSVYELYGDVSGLKTLEIIPNTPVGGEALRQVVDVDSLPSTDTGNPDGGYAPASYEAVDGQLIVKMQPVGAVNAWYARLLNGVYFRDSQGNELFDDIFVKKIKNRSDGTITVISMPTEASYQRDVDKVAQIWFFVQKYELLEGRKAVIRLDAR
ncbi:DUF4179 domain-containing protein [Intestinimonas massiliensis (ex Afouda et al. 2020)]|uniref:DUF4179 domain-containing protein n=1 Tax=Intestinimonas massiliensis (ex Afouda et al. 2020) TaxID=1673721 RepID=UPI001031613F|nr:DUF4179 domain-containing protein [Intestinimonas massiliensis (ex Afouda et al. 2020)]